MRLDGSASMELTGVAVSRALPATEMVAGRTALVETGEGGDPAQAILIAVVA